MTSNNANWLLNYMIVAPFLIVGLALAVYWFTGWQDRREQKRNRAAE